MLKHIKTTVWIQIIQDDRKESSQPAEIFIAFRNFLVYYNVSIKFYLYILFVQLYKPIIDLHTFKFFIHYLYFMSDAF